MAKVILIFILLMISVIDYLTYKIPLVLNILLLSIVISEKVMMKSNEFFIILNVLTGFLFFIVIHILTSGNLGLGDAILSASIAVLHGIRIWLIILLSASVIALVYMAILYLIFKKEIKQKRIAFAPFLSIPTIVFLII